MKTLFNLIMPFTAGLAFSAGLDDIAIVFIVISILTNLATTASYNFSSLKYNLLMILLLMLMSIFTYALTIEREAILGIIVFVLFAFTTYLEIKVVE